MVFLNISNLNQSDQPTWEENVGHNQNTMTMITIGKLHHHGTHSNIAWTTASANLEASNSIAKP